MKSTANWKSYSRINKKGVRALFSKIVLTLLFLSNYCLAQGPREWPAPRPVDLQQAAALGIREIAGRHLRLLTDVPRQPAVDELPQIFDAAVAHWAAYFQIPTKQLADWKVQGYLIQERQKFAALHLLPAGHTEYLNGYALGNELWLDEQQSDYYRRHLLLHEGTHSFMLSQLGSAGPGWYMEGMAELLGTHRWEGGQLQMGIMPANRAEVPLWGRIKVIRTAVEEHATRSIGEVFSIDNRQALSVDAYSWCWALCKFLDSHPRYREPFRKLPTIVNRADFTSRFRRMVHGDWSDINFEWRAFLAELDYGYQCEPMTMQHARSAPLKGPDTFVLAADRGWQATPWQLEEGSAYRISASGRFQIADDGDPWPCEPGGVTLRYHAGHPLGMLLGALRPTASRYEAGAEISPNESGDITNPLPLGLESTIRPTMDCQLYLRVNDSPAELSDNLGTVTVRIEPLPTD